MTQNLFLANLGKHAAQTANGAVSNSTTGRLLVDQFAKAGAAKGRNIQEVFADQSAIWGEDALGALRFAFYLRMITRKTKLFGGEQTETVQQGQGNQDEALKRMLWVALYHPETFYKNLWIVPLVGSWKDLWILLTMSDELKKEEFFKTMAEGINDENQKGLVLKYLPRIRSNKKCVSEWAIKTNQLAKEFCNFIGWKAEHYRKFKSTGIAHKFQQLMCGRLYDNIDFNQIPGRALSIMLANGGKWLKNHNLETKYQEWIEKQPVAKFTGFVYELGKQVPSVNNYMTKPLSYIQKMTIDKQFDGLIKLAKSDNDGIKGNVWCCLDTSGSMNACIHGLKDVRCCDIANSLAVYFSTLNEGAFHKSVLAFDNTSKHYKLSGTFTDMMSNLPRVGCGGTNFQGAIDEILRVRRSNLNIPLEDYPKTLLVISDMQFNPTSNSGYWGGYSNRKLSKTEVSTNYEESKRKLLQAFPKEFVDEMKFIWWHVTSQYKDFPSSIDDPGTYMFSGFDGAVVSLLLGGDATVVDEKTGETRQLSMEEMVQKVLTQELLLQLKL